MHEAENYHPNQPFDQFSYTDQVPINLALNANSIGINSMGIPNQGTITSAYGNNDKIFIEDAGVSDVMTEGLPLT